MNMLKRVKCRSAKTRIQYLAIAAACMLMLPAAVAAETPSGSDVFDDVPEGHWANEAIGWAVTNGITRGVSDTLFNPDGTVTRAQLVTFLYRLAILNNAVDIPSADLFFTTLGYRGPTLWSSDVTNPEPKEVAQEEHLGWYSALSPDLSRVAYIRGQVELWTVNTDGGITDPELLTSHGNDRLRGPVWSPDSSSVAYVREKSGNIDDREQLWVVSSDGEGRQQLASGFAIGSPKWSPDGARMTYENVEIGRSEEIWTVDADGTHEKRLTEHSDAATSPAWSPDGARIAYVVDWMDLWTMNADGTDQRLLYEGEIAVQSPAWSPDGSRVAFTLGRRSNPYVGAIGVWVTNIDGTDQRQLGGWWGSLGTVVWSPDGKHLGVVGHPSESEEYSGWADGDDITIWIVDTDTGDRAVSGVGVGNVNLLWWVDGSSLENPGFGDVPLGHWAEKPIEWAVENGITRGVGNNRFDPDGVLTRSQIAAFLYRLTGLIGNRSVPSAPEERILFTSQRGDTRYLYSMRPDGSDAIRLTEDTAWKSWAAWSPDGTRVAFGRGQSDYDLWIMNADGTGQTPLTDVENTLDLYPSWSPDGTRIAFQRVTSEEFTLWVINADGTGETQLASPFPSASHVAAPSWSPDGTRIAFMHSRWWEDHFQIWVMNADGTNHARLTEGEQLDSAPAWSPDSSQIAFQREGGGASQIWVMNADGTNQRQITQGDEGSGVPAWSPDGSHIVFARDRDHDGEFLFDGDSALWVMNADGTNQRQLFDGTHAEFVSPQGWSPRALTPVLGSDLFGDIPGNHWGNRAIGWGASVGVVPGATHLGFGPDNSVSRAEMATFLRSANDLLRD